MGTLADNIGKSGQLSVSAYINFSCIGRSLDFFFVFADSLLYSPLGFCLEYNQKGC